MGAGQLAKKHYETYRLYQRGQTWYAYISFTTADGRHISSRKSLCTDIRQEAERRVNAEIAQYITSDGIDTPRITISDAFARYYQEKGQHLVGAKYILSNLLYIAQHLNITYLDELDKTTLQKYVDFRRNEVSHASVNRELAKLSAIRTLAEEFWDCRVNKAKPLKFRLKEPAENIKYLPDWQSAQRIIDKAPEHLKPIIYTALYTGLRKSNILNLRWQDVDFSNNLINVTVKDKNVSGGHLLTLPMIKSLREIFEAQPKINEYIFNYNGHKIGDIKHAWMHIFYDNNGKLKDVTLPYINFHTLRHTAATWILRKTNNLKLTQQILGHSNIKTTLKYAHVIDSEKRRALEDVFE
jgi:integrase